MPSILVQCIGVSSRLPRRRSSKSICLSTRLRSAGSADASGAVAKIASAKAANRPKASILRRWESRASMLIYRPYAKGAGSDNALSARLGDRIDGKCAGRGIRGRDLHQTGLADGDCPATDRDHKVVIITESLLIQRKKAEKAESACRREACRRFWTAP